MDRETVSFCFCALQGIAAAVYLGKEIVQWARARRGGDMKPLTVHHPFWLLGLVAGCLLTAGLGFWFVFHPPTSFTSTQPKPPIQAAQPSQVVQELPQKPQTFTTQKPARNAVPSDTKQATVHGSDNTIVGNDHRNIEGNGNTIMGATDANGNTILNRGGTAIGRGAKADQSSIAIGAGANAGTQVTQSTNAPCSGNSVGGNVDNSGCQVGTVPPPNRVIEATSREAAVALLKTAPTGSKVYFVVIGGGQEIGDFEQSLESIFTDGGWAISGRSFIGQASSVIATGNGVIHSGGEGFNCEAQTAAGQTARKALKAAGYPCGDGPIAGREGNADIYVRVGSRIAPQE